MGDKWEQNPVWFIVNGFCWNRYMFDYFKHNSAKSLGRYSKMQPAQKKKKVPARWTKGGKTLLVYSKIHAICNRRGPLMFQTHPLGPKQCGNIPTWQVDFAQLVSQSSDIWMVSHNLGDTQISNC